VFSGIHKRIHVAQGEEFALRAELNYEFLDGEYPYEIENDERMVLRSDYDGRIDVVPVSDPNIFSNAQRIAQAQATFEMSQQMPHVIDQREAAMRLMKALRIPEPEKVVKGGEIKRMDPINENMALLTGSSARAFVEQDHDAHLAVHQAFLGGLNDQAMQMVGGAFQAHLAEHYALKYYTDLNRQLGGALPPPTFMQSDAEEELPPEVEAQIAQMAAQIPKIELMPQEEEEDGEEEFAAEEQRKQMAFEADEQRKQTSFVSEQKRRDEMTAAEIERKRRESVAELSRKEELLELEKKQKRNEARNSDGEG
jgi:hypothetical protein